ncbi:MAG: DNA polymerase III subunit chi [Caldimonas sp.]
MTEIGFYFNAASRSGYACRLLRKAQRQGMSLAVVGNAAALDELDRELWSFDAVEFVAHQRVDRLADVPESLRARTVWLGENPLDAPVHDALLNLGDAPPRGFETFARMFEIVSADEGDRAAARERWKAYAHRGYPIKRHEVSA